MHRFPKPRTFPSVEHILVLSTKQSQIPPKIKGFIADKRKASVKDDVTYLCLRRTMAQLFAQCECRIVTAMPLTCLCTVQEVCFSCRLYLYLYRYRAYRPTLPVPIQAHRLHRYLYRPTAWATETQKSNDGDIQGHPVGQ